MVAVGMMEMGPRSQGKVNIIGLLYVACKCLMVMPQGKRCPFVPPRAGAVATDAATTPGALPEEDKIDDLRRQMKDMQDRLERMSKEPKKEE